MRGWGLLVVALIGYPLFAYLLVLALWPHGLR